MGTLGATALDRTFHALGDATRRGMVSLLARRGECTAGEMGRPFRVAQPTASKHIRVLERAGLIARRVEGRTHWFSLRREAMSEAAGWIEAQRAFWSSSLEELGAYLEDEHGGGATR